MTKALATRRTGTRKDPRPNTAERIRTLAADGMRWTSIAAKLDVDPKTLRRWREENPALQEAFEEGRERERVTLHTLLIDQARKGNTTAAIFLLKAAHGYREGDQSDQPRGVTVNIALPGAMTLQQFTAMTEGPAK